MRKVVLLAVALSISATCLADEIDDLIGEYMEATNTPGLSIALVKRGARPEFRSYGKADLELDVAVTPDTVFEIGSVSKQFAAAGVLMLADEGKLGLDDNLGTHVEKFSDDWKRVTVRQALGHTGGLREYTGLGFNIRKDYREDELLEFAQNRGLYYEPGECWSYSNSGYFVAGVLVEQITDLPWAEFTQERIFDRLGMKSSAIVKPDVLIPGRAQGYQYLQEHRNAEYFRPNGNAGAAGAIMSSARDMAKWANAVLEGELLSEESHEAWWSPVLVQGDREWPYGLGWMFEESPGGERVVHHGGNTFGMSAEIFLLPGRDWGIVALCNMQGLSLTGLCGRIAAIKFPEVVESDVEEHREQPDPDKELTWKLVDAFNFAIRGQVQETDYLDGEMVAFLNTMRGRSALGGLRSPLGLVRTMRYMGEEPFGEDRWVRYNVLFEKAGLVQMRLLVTPEGKLARMEGG